MLNYPAGYYQRFNPSTKDWKYLLFRPNMALQSAELNEVQAMVAYQFEKHFRGIRRDGAYTTGGSITTTTNENDITVTISAGEFQASGFIHSVPEKSITITGVGTEVVGIKLIPQIITEVEDPDLVDPAQGYENYQYEGADRLQLDYQIKLNDATAITVATFIDGQLQVIPVNSDLMDILAERTRDESGSYIVEVPTLEFKDIGAADTQPTFLKLEISKGKGYAYGYQVKNTNKVNLSLVRPLTGEQREVEPHTFITGTKKYTLDVGPVLSIDEVNATIQSPTFQMTKGVPNGSDPIPSTYQPVSSVVSVVQGVTTYTEGDDFIRVGNYIQWQAGSTHTHPAQGSSYDVVVRYNVEFVQGKRVKTSVNNEAKTVSSGAFTLSNTKMTNELPVVTNTAGTVTYVLGTDYTYNKRTAVFTCSGALTNGTNVLVDYSYFATSGTGYVQGDYLSRDSWVDAAGVVLYNQTPTYLPDSDTTIDYKTQICMGATGLNRTPVNGTPVNVDYTYILPRTDVLVWGKDGRLMTLPGVPSLTPVAPRIADDYLPIAKLKLPAEATASTTTIEFFDNVRMPFTELRTLSRRVHDVQYNLSVLQLAQDTTNIATPTAQRGIFADSFQTTHLADVTHADFAGTFDILTRTFSLPRTGESTNITSQITATNASLKDNVWFKTFTETVLLNQPYSSETMAINPFGYLNTKAKVVIDPNPLIHVDDQIVSIESNWHPAITAPAVSLKQNRLLQMIAPNTAAAAVKGVGQVLDPKLLQSINVDDDWLAVINNADGTQTGVVSYSNDEFGGWNTVLANTQVFVVDSGLPVAKTISITGSKFTANERQIMAYMDGKPLTLTATGATAQETATNYGNGVKANSTGDFTANATIPAGTKNGTYNIEFIGHSSSDLTQPKSISYAYLDVGTYRREVSLQVEASDPDLYGSAGMYPTQIICAIFGFPMTYEVQAAGHVSSAHVIAEAVAQANRLGINVTDNLLMAALVAMWSRACRLQPKPTLAQNQAIVDALTTNSTDPTLLYNELGALRNTEWYLNAAFFGGIVTDAGMVWTGLWTWEAVDPLAQTFTLDQDCDVTSIDLYFAEAPAAGYQVVVHLAEVLNGYPTDKYLGTSIKTSGFSTSSATNFAFPQPVRLKQGIEYAFVVMTEDPDATLHIARLGGTDPSNGLITKNAYAGAMFKSPNASSWEVDSTADIQFRLNKAVYTTDQAKLDFGEITFTDSRSIFAIYAPFLELDHTTKVSFQYALPSSPNTWITVSPLKEVDLGSAYDSAYFRILMDGSASAAPRVTNSAVLDTYINQNSGAYVHRLITLPNEDSRYVHVYVNTKVPGNTSLAVKVRYADTGSWHDATEQVGDQIDLGNGWIERHYTYDNGSGNEEQEIRTKIILTTSSGSEYVTPEIAKYRMIAA